MLESNLADNDLAALPEAANDAMFAMHGDGACLTEFGASAMLQGNAPLGRRRIGVARFRESGAAMFRPFRVY